MNDVYKKISEYLHERSISLFSAVHLSDCKIIRPYLLERAEISAESGNISEYAKGLDYHIFFKSLFDDIIPLLKKDFPKAHFAGFTDHSPVDEINAAALAGIGIIGKNGLLITEKYSSFVFIGEIVTDLTIDCLPSAIKHCEDCGLCTSACPVMCDKGICLSALTQKKGELSKEEAKTIFEFGSAWGCDICQRACPHTISALESGSIYTSIPFFKENTLPTLTYDAVNMMLPEEFSQRAYSWRGKQTILRNLRIIDGNKQDE